MADQTIYRIAKWQATFETAESRRYAKLSWVALPVGFSSNGYSEMIMEFGDEAPAVYGAWCALLLVASQTEERGTLKSSKGGFTVKRIAYETRMPESVFEKLLQWATREDIGWVEIVDETTPKREPPSDHPTDTQQPNGNGRENVELQRQNRDRTETEQNRDNNNSVITEVTVKQGSNPKKNSGAPPPPAVPAVIVNLLDLEETAAEVFRRCGYGGSDGGIFWKAAALHHQRAISDDELWAACEATQQRGQNKPGYFRRTLGKILSERELDIGFALQKVRIVPHLPKSKPTFSGEPP